MQGEHLAEEENKMMERRVGSGKKVKSVWSCLGATPFIISILLLPAAVDSYY